MKRKILIIAICTLLITLVLPVSIANEKPTTTTEEDVEISISAGFRGKDFGIAIAVEIINHKTEDLPVFYNITFDYIIPNALDFSDAWKEIVPAEETSRVQISTFVCAPDGIKFISLTVEAGNKIVTRTGFSIRRLIMFFK